MDTKRFPRQLLPIIGTWLLAVFPIGNYFLCGWLDRIKDTTYRLMPYLIHTAFLEPLLFALLLGAAVYCFMGQMKRAEAGASCKLGTVAFHSGAVICLATAIAGPPFLSLRLFRLYDGFLQHANGYAWIVGILYLAAGICLTITQRKASAANG